MVGLGLAPRGTRAGAGLGPTLTLLRGLEGGVLTRAAGAQRGEGDGLLAVAVAVTPVVDGEVVGLEQTEDDEQNGLAKAFGAGEFVGAGLFIKLRD